MEKATNLRIKTLSNCIARLLSGVENKNASVIKVNSENLSIIGDLCLLTNLQAWKTNIAKDSKHVSDHATILEHFLIGNNIEFQEEEVSDKAFGELLRSSGDWPLRIEKCILRKERVCVFLNRADTFTSVIKSALSQCGKYGESTSVDKCFFLKIDQDKESELTNLRLRLIKDVSENILTANGFQISETDNASKYKLTVKSQSDMEENYQKLLCGVVKNSASKTKETELTQMMYLNHRIKELLESNEHKFPLTDSHRQRYDSFLQRLATAMITVELLAVKPSHTVSVGHDLNSDRSVGSLNGSSFILYNTARISAILRKFEDERLAGKYPSLADIDEVNFSLLDQEEEWELLYNFILGYPEMVHGCIRNVKNLEVCPQNICSYLSHLCKKFSAYYRRVRVLTEGRDHLVPVMMARLHLLKALEVVLHNALALLKIDPTSRM